MGRRYFKKLPWYVSFTQTWGNKRGMGRFWKRQLSKARRRYAKNLLKYGRGKEPVGLESEVNWKGW